MKPVTFLTALFILFATFFSQNLCAQWSSNSTAMWTTNINLNIGIGMASPTNAKVQFNNALGNKMTLFQRTATEAYGLGMNNDNMSVYIPSGSRFSVRNNSYSGAEKFVVTYDGKVGVGATAPNYEMDVRGTISNGGSDFVLGKYDARPQGSNTLNRAMVHSLTGDQLVINWEGDFEGGTFINGPRLGVNKYIYAGYDNTNSGTFDLRFGNQSTGEGIGSKRTAGGNQNGLDFYTGSFNRLSITNSGNIGIGVSTPTNAKLQFANTVGNKITLFESSTGVAYGFGINDYNLSTYIPNGARFSVRTNGYNGAEKFVVTSDGNVGIGTTTPSDKLRVEGDIRCFNIFTNSDRRYKTGIQTLEGALDKVLAMRGASYNFAASQIPADYTASKQVGFIAQEMKEVMPELVKADADGMMSVNYIGVIPVLVEALKEQHEVIEEKETRIAALEAKNNELQTRLARIEAALGIAADRQEAPAAVTATVSPNPSAGIVIVSLNQPASAKSVIVKIVDNTGREIASRNATGAGSLQFDLSQFPAGVYVAQVFVDGSLLSSNKVQLVK